MMIEHHRY